MLKDKTLRKLSNSLYPSTIRELCLLCEADQSGRPPLPKGRSEKIKQIFERADFLGILDQKPERLITGKDLIEAGYIPGPEMGKILDKLYEMQLRGSFDSKEQGIRQAKGIKFNESNLY